VTDIRVLVYDDNKGRQDALKLLIDNTSGMNCVGTFDNCANVVEQVEQTKPTVVLMDIDMPEVNGIEGLKRIRQHSPEVLVVMQTVFEEDDKIFEAIRSGAHGYFLKKTPSAKLVEGIRDVFNGGAPMTSVVARKVLHMFYHQPVANRQHFDLTERELEILSHLVKGLSYKMIADVCSITFHTVNSHCKKIYEKLHVHSATEAVAKAIEHRIV
jgi:DNA-binding NarL/FixJ family response regulator